jgi:SAM-dependent methyltransferase
MRTSSLEQHNIEIAKNLEYWNNKPLLQKIYANYYRQIIAQLNYNLPGKVVELGSGIGNFKQFYPACICTDIFPNPWIDQVESAYALSFPDASVSHLIMVDVFHHLKFPGSALQEFSRVLSPGGRVIILDPSLSALGLLVWGPLHHEPIGLFKKITWATTDNSVLHNSVYYAAQGNATRIFGGKKYRPLLEKWNILHKKKMSAISHMASGGYSKPAFYPESALPLMQQLEKVLDLFPWLFATRILVVLEKK